MARCKKRRSCIRVGTDFSGLDAPLLAFRRLELPVRHVFSSDSQETCRKVIAHTHKPDVIYTDIRTRDNSLVFGCDVYCAGFPCQDFSSLGKSRGAENPQGRGLLVCFSLDFIKHKVPSVVILENVKGFPQNHKELMQLVLSTLAELGYVTAWRIMDTSFCGLPHHRRRWYCVCIRADCLREEGVTEPLDISYVFPSEPEQNIELSSIVQRLPEEDFRMYPDPTVSSLAHQHVVNAYAKAATTHPGINPFLRPIIVDIGASLRFASHAVDFMLCMTRTRASQYGYWCSSKGGPLEWQELSQLQGIRPDEVDWQGAGITERQYCGMMGNTMSINVLTALIPNVLYAAKLVDAAAWRRMTALRRRTGPL